MSSTAQPAPAPASKEALHPIVAATATLAAKAVLDRKGEALTVLDVSGRTSVCDALILATGSHARHVSAIADGVIRAWKGEKGSPPLGVEGTETGRWVLIDLGDVVVHLFDGPMRGYYDLDGLWMDARQVPLEELGLEEHVVEEEEEDDDWDDDYGFDLG